MSDINGIGLIIVYNILFIWMGFYYLKGNLPNKEGYIKKLLSFNMYEGFENSRFIRETMKISGKMLFLMILMFDVFIYFIWLYYPDFFALGEYFSIISILLFGTFVSQIIVDKLSRNKILNLAKEENELLLVDIGNKKLKKIVSPILELGYMLTVIIALYIETDFNVVLIYCACPILAYWSISIKPLKTEKSYKLSIRGLLLTTLMGVLAKAIFIIITITHYTGLISFLVIFSLLIFLVLQIKLLINNGAFLDSLYEEKSEEEAHKDSVFMKKIIRTVLIVLVAFSVFILTIILMKAKYPMDTTEVIILVSSSLTSVGLIWVIIRLNRTLRIKY